MTVSDHYSLLWPSKLQNPSGRLARWAVRIQQYDFTIVHRKGEEHAVPDALSRAVPLLDSIGVSVSQDRWYDRLKAGINSSPDKYPSFRLIDGEPHKLVRSPYADLVDERSQWKRIVHKNGRKEIIRQCHDESTSGHLGAYKTVSRVSQKYIGKFFAPKYCGSSV